MKRTAQLVTLLSLLAAMLLAFWPYPASAAAPRCVARQADVQILNAPLTKPGQVCESWFGDYVPPTWTIVHEDWAGSTRIQLTLRRPIDPPLCVTTTWRAKHTGQPKTKPGHTCRFAGITDDQPMWRPKGWVQVGEWLDPQGNISPILWRPRA